MNTTPERRRHTRFKVAPGAYAAIRTTPHTLGQIKNISKGGLAIQYVDLGEPKQHNGSMDIFVSGRHSFVRQLPVKTITDFKVDNEVPFSSLQIRQMSVQFGHLEDQQQIQLNAFINDHTIGSA